jgi:hypothetical protein
MAGDRQRKPSPSHIRRCAQRHLRSWTAVAGYRYFFVEKEIDGQDVQLDLHGPLFGITYRF